ncbi:hypothetical protein H2198_010990 [Neophaeococcomyces mojaviensis]|uniref:Uncharacterized protein n=1 Tax=Neophaeococcomyces mojaviensis TaxID=3383035 RepID=A0ACC2ZM50_9EURO|nr:hypothetical protein H2198_010990 [Knufia sp. JES_112]
MRVLKLDQALALERLVRQRGQAPQAADAVDAPPIANADREHVLLRLSGWDVVRMGLLSNRGWALAVAAFGVLFQTVPRPVMDDAIERGGREAFGYASHLHPGMAGAFLLLAAALLLGWLALRILSVVLTLLRYHGFTLSEQDRRLTVSAGLLSRTRSSVARRRIQAWTLREGTLQRWFGLRQLRIDSAAGGPSRDEDRALRELAPLASTGAAPAATVAMATGAVAVHSAARLVAAVPGRTGGGTAVGGSRVLALGNVGVGGIGLVAGSVAGRAPADGTHGLVPGRPLRGGARRLVEALVALGRAGQGAGPAPAALTAGQAARHQQPAAGYRRRAWRCGTDPAPSAAGTGPAGDGAAGRSAGTAQAALVARPIIEPPSTHGVDLP